MSTCYHAVVGVLIVHQGRVAVAKRQKPPLNLAPSAGHVDPDEDYLSLPVVRTAGKTGVIPLYDLRDGNPEAFRRAAAREAHEETGLPVHWDRLKLLLTYQAEDDCAKSAYDGSAGGRHVWQVFAYEVRTMSEPTLADEPGKMHGWTFRSVNSLLDDPDLEPIWGTLLREILREPDNWDLLTT